MRGGSRLGVTKNGRSAGLDCAARRLGTRCARKKSFLCSDRCLVNILRERVQRMKRRIVHPEAKKTNNDFIEYVLRKKGKKLKIPFCSI